MSCVLNHCAVDRVPSHCAVSRCAVCRVLNHCAVDRVPSRCAVCRCAVSHCAVCRVLDHCAVSRVSVAAAGSRTAASRSRCPSSVAAAPHDAGVRRTPLSGDSAPDTHHRTTTIFVVRPTTSCFADWSKRRHVTRRYRMLNGRRFNIQKC